MKILLRFTTILSALLLNTLVHAQIVPPPYINYQAVLYDVNGPNPNAPYALQSFPAYVNISDQLGNTVYREEHFASTDQNGVVTLKMGDGLYLSGSVTVFNDIPWETGKYYLVVEYDINGTISATAPEQLVSVPYSFYSGQAGNGITTVTDNGNGTLTFNFLDGSSYTTAPLTGIQGPAGATGPVGPQGPQGPAGNDGAQGIQGPAGSNGTNGADGASAYEIWIAQGNTGTEADFLNAIEGAQGPAGAVGPQGPQGNDGATGPQGIQGIQGPAGNNGINGADGASAYEIWIAQGNTGTEADFLNAIEGAQGPAGATGPQGPAGNDGATGPQGPQGIQGPAGATGAQGPQGPAGRSAYESALLNGFVGTEAEWLASLEGPQGPQGIQGIQGPAGNNGINGADGASAYEIWIAQGNTGTEADFLNAIEGSQGPAGATGQGGVSMAGTNVTITGTGTAGDPYVVNATDNVDDADSNPTNELQALSLSNDTLYLSSGNSVYLGNVVGSSGNPPGFPGGFNNMLPVFGAQSGCMTWGSESQEDYVDGIIQGDGGMIILAKQAGDFLLYRTNPLGQIIRKIKLYISGAASATLTSFCQHPTNGNLYFTGSYNNTLRLSITDSTGSTVIGHYGWSNLGEGDKVIFGSDNNLYILASCNPPYGNGSTDVVVAKVNLTGTITNKFVYGTAGGEVSNDLIQLSDGNLLVSFRNNGGYAVVTKINTSFAILWSKQLDLGSNSVLFQSSTGHIYVSYDGNTTNTLRIAKIALDGTFVLGKNYSFTGYSLASLTPRCLTEKSLDSLVLIGQFNNTSSAQAGFAINLSNLGVVQSSKFGGSGEPHTYQTFKEVFYHNNHIYLFGETNLIGWGDRDISGTKLSTANTTCCLGALTVGTTNNFVITNYSGTTATFTHVNSACTWFVSYPVLKVYSECYE